MEAADEDTLDELDGVPAIDAVTPPDEAASAADGAGKPKRSRARLVTALVLILIALAVIAIVLWRLSTR
jgi:hypothetical protein